MKIIEIGITILSAILMMIGLFMIENGSLEAFPTLEQIKKARIGDIVLVSIGVCVESIIMIRVFKSKKER